MAHVKEKTLGEVRYFTYWLRFPDGEEWVDQIPFVHDLRYELSQPLFDLHILKKHDLLTKGETYWTDNNSVVHHVKVETEERKRKWGTKTPKFKPRGRKVLRKA